MALARYYLFITENGLTVSTGQREQFRQVESFTADLAGLGDFERFIDANRQALYYVLVDLQEEDYRAENIPHVGASNRQRILRRRLESLYRDTPYRSATPQGRETTGRKDDRFLLAALTNRNPIDRWLERLIERDAKVAGLYSITLLTARHARSIKAIPARALIVSRQQGSGLRQTYIADGSLRFSRLTEPTGESLEELASQLAAEAGRARQFLASLRAIDRVEVMQVVMFCGEGEIATLAHSCPDSELIHYHFVPVAALAESFKLPASGLGNTTESTWLRFLADRRPSNQYATAPQRSAYQAWQLTRVLHALTALTLVASTGAASWYWRQVSLLDRDTLVQQQRQQAADQLYAANAPKANAGDLTPTGMKNVVLAYRQMVEQWPQLTPALADVAQVVEQFPEMEVETLAWQISPSPDALPTEFTDATAAAQPAPAPPADAAQPAQMRYVIVGIKAQLPGYELRARDSLALVDKIAAAFAKLPGAKVSKLQLPIDIRSESTISLAANNAGQDGAPFALKIVRPVPAPPSSQVPTP
jgi:hypothetical protein